jgi:hypothetical protein
MDVVNVAFVFTNANTNMVLNSEPYGYVNGQILTNITILANISNSSPICQLPNLKKDSIVFSML